MTSNAVQQEPALAPVDSHSSFAALNRWMIVHSKLLLTTWSIAVAAMLLVVSSNKPVSNDEALFLWSAGRENAIGVWQALVAGVNQDPPLAHLITHALLVTGGGATVARLPAICGFVAMGVFAFLFLRGRVQPLYATSALIMPFGTFAFFYATEARPYGLLLGLSALTLYTWDRMWRQSANLRAAVLFGVALTSALACHFYAVFLLVPLVAATVHRWYNQDARSRSVLVVLVSASATVLAWLPIILSVRQFKGHHYAAASFTGLRQYYSQLFTDPLFTVGLFLTGALAVLSFPIVSERHERLRPPFVNAADAMLLLGFATIPLLALAAGIAVTKIMAVHYLLFTLTGWLVTIPILCSWCFGARSRIAIVLLMALAVPSLVNVREALQFVYPDRYTAEELTTLSGMVPRDGLDTIIPKPNVFAALHYYAPQEVGQRIAYLSDDAISVRTLGHDTIDRTYALLTKADQTYRVFPLRSYVQTHAQFYVLSTTPAFTTNWLEAWAERTPLQVVVIKEVNGMTLLKVTTT